MAKRNQTKAQMRNLAQFKNLPEEDFESMWEKKETSGKHSKNFEDRIQKKIDEFGLDYDLDDLKINDRESLKALVMALISLEDYEYMLYNLKSAEDITQANINIVERISGVMSYLRRDISKLQEDLNITRKNRKSDKESSVINYISNLKEQARKFHESRSQYVFCPSCNVLLGNVWCLYPEDDNKFSFVCKRKLDDGTVCNTKVVVTSKELLENRGTNKPEITPEGIL